MTKKTHQRKQLVIEKFVKPPINWPREMKTLGQILHGYPLEFLEFLVLGFQVKSLNSFRYERLQNTLKKEKKKFDIINAKEEEEFVCNEDKPYERVFEKKESLKDKLGI